MFRHILNMFDEEVAHHIASFALENGWLGKRLQKFPRLEQEFCGLKLKNAVGLAAGFDKNSELILPLSQQNFASIECGTVTPLPQEGNPKKRLFRLKEDKAIINRMGFNNVGSVKFTTNFIKQRLASDKFFETYLSHPAKQPKGSWESEPPKKFFRTPVLGINIGKNKDSDEGDYIKMLHQFYGIADYITINISSPNTAGLRDMQQKSLLEDFLKKIAANRTTLEERQKAEDGISFPKPVFLKIAPDLDRPQIQQITNACIDNNIDAIIISNTTIERGGGLKSRHSGEKGGLSGKPLREISDKALAVAYEASGGKIPLVGCGGVFSGEDAFRKIQLGASFVQIYSAIIFNGFDIVNKINQELDAILQAKGFEEITQAIGSY